MPDSQTTNAILSAYGLSGLLGPGGFSWWNLLAGTIFGIVGWYAFWQGKKDRSWRPMVIGAALMVYTFFVASTLWVIIIGLALCVALYFWRG
jgi:hypothetical protein